MPDISMCSPSKIETICKTCHRLNADPDKWQSYVRFTPNESGLSCKNYLPPKEGDIKW